MGAFLNEDWDCLGTMFNYQVANFGASSNVWPIDKANTNVGGFDKISLYSCDTTLVTSLSYFYQESGNSSNNGVSFATLTHKNDSLCDFDLRSVLTSDTSTFTEYSVVDDKSYASLAHVFLDNSLVRDIACVKEELGNGELGVMGKEMPLKRKFQMAKLQKATTHKISNEPFENPKKKSRALKDLKKNKRNEQSKKNHKHTTNGNNAEKTKTEQNSLCCNSEDEYSNASENLNEATISDSEVKTRTNRGSATDPQSLYARKRREKINERLRILQNLVPNGTKVDISTMLEEAVHYVKFLQLQIKLLSSDDMWMYAPIAHNGMAGHGHVPKDLPKPLIS